MQVGTDIIELVRIKKALDKSATFADKVLSVQELEIFKKYQGQRQIEFLAGRFCAKEAYVKARCIGFRSKLTMPSIEFLPDKYGALEISQGPLCREVAISISHSKTVATATCIINLEKAEIYQKLLQEGITI